MKFEPERHLRGTRLRSTIRRVTYRAVTQIKHSKCDETRKSSFLKIEQEESYPGTQIYILE